MASEETLNSICLSLGIPHSHELFSRLIVDCTKWNVHNPLVVLAVDTGLTADAYLKTVKLKLYDRFVATDLKFDMDIFAQKQGKDLVVFLKKMKVPVYYQGKPLAGGVFTTPMEFVETYCNLYENDVRNFPSVKMEDRVMIGRHGKDCACEITINSRLFSFLYIPTCRLEHYKDHLRRIKEYNGEEPDYDEREESKKYWKSTGNDYYSDLDEEAYAGAYEEHKNNKRRAKKQKENNE